MPRPESQSSMVKPNVTGAQHRSKETALEIGQLLRQARQARGEDLDQAAEHLLIRPKYLAALEAGDLAQIPARAYLLGYLRSYSSHLGLDSADLVSRLKSVIDRDTGRPGQTGHGRITGTRRGAPVSVMASLLLVATIYAGYHLASHTKDIGTGRVESLAD